jgi:hypothetical protein
LVGVEANIMIIIDWKNKKVENISTHNTNIEYVELLKNNK